MTNINLRGPIYFKNWNLKNWNLKDNREHEVE